jgi:hypothetical protein
MHISLFKFYIHNGDDTKVPFIYSELFPIKMVTLAFDMFVCPHRIVCFLLAGFLLQSVNVIQAWLTHDLHTHQIPCFL